MALTAHTSAYTGNIHDWALKEVTFGPFAAAGLADGNYPLFVFPEAVDIEKITVRATAWAAASPDVVTFKTAASGIAIGSATAITDAETLYNYTADTSYDVPFLATNVQTGLASGTQLSMTTGGTIASLAGFMITVVYRKAPNRRDTSTNAQKIDKSKFFYTSNV